MTSMPPAAGGSDFSRTAIDSDTTASPPQWWPGSLVRAWIAVAAAGLIAACLLCMALVSHFWDEATLRNEQQQQEMVVSFAARALDARLETYQRVLQSIALSLHTSTLEPSAPLELQLYEASSHVGIFDSLMVADLRRVTQLYESDANTKDASHEAQLALQQTLADGKPQVRAVMSESDSPHLKVIFAIALRNAEGAVRGGLAGIARVARSSILPAELELASAQQFVLANADGRALAISVANAPQSAVRFSQQPVPAQWQSLMESRTTAPQSELFAGNLVTRVPLPLPRWHMFAVRDIGSKLHGWQRMSGWQWLVMLLLMALLVSGVIGVLLWLSKPINALLAQPRWSRRKTGGEIIAERRRATDNGPTSKFALQAALQAETQNIQAHLKALEQMCEQSQTNYAQLEASLRQLMQAMPVGMIWLEDDKVRYANPLVARLLGMNMQALEGKQVQTLLREQTNAEIWLQHASQTVQDFGHYREEVLWQTPAGQRNWLMLQGSLLHQPAQGSVWILQDAKELRANRETEWWQCMHDRATGLLNRKGLAEAVEPLCENALTGLSVQVPHACLWIEMDYLQVLQNHAGQSAAQSVLCQLAYLLQREAPTGYAARMAENALVLWLYAPNDADPVQTLAWRLCERVAQWSPVFKGQCYGFGLSIGWWWAAAAPPHIDAGLKLAQRASAAARREGQGKAVKSIPDWC